jgi:Amt family ammonium transporter
MTGLVATTAVNQASGLLEGNVQQFLVNTAAALVVMVYAFAATYLIARLVDRLMGLRVTEEEEYVGLDISQHGERISY